MGQCRVVGILGGVGVGRGHSTWHVVACVRVVRFGRQRHLRTQFGNLPLVERLRAGERSCDDRRVAQLGGKVEGGRQAVGVRLASVRPIILQKGDIASKAGEDEGRRAVCFGTASCARRLRSWRLQQQPTRCMRIAEHTLGNEGRIEHLDFGTRRHECSKQLRVVSSVGKNERRVATRRSPPPIGIGPRS